VDSLLPVLIALGCVGLLALIVVLIVFSVRRERQRQARIRQWAERRGWTVTVRPRGIEWTSLLPGRNRRGVSLLLSGTLYGRPVAIAEYSYTVTTSTGTSGGSTTVTYNFIVTVARLPAWYPPVAVQPRGAMSKLGRSIFGDNAAATGHEEFDRRFRVVTKDPAASRALIGPALVGEHLAGRIPGWSLAGQDLLTWQVGPIKDPSQLETVAAPVLRIADLLGR
jgi:hypothetical protein